MKRVAALMIVLFFAQLSVAQEQEICLSQGQVKQGGIRITTIDDFSRVKVVIIDHGSNYGYLYFKQGNYLNNLILIIDTATTKIIDNLSRGHVTSSGDTFFYVIDGNNRNRDTIGHFGLFPGIQYRASLVYKFEGTKETTIDWYAGEVKNPSDCSCRE